MFSRVTFYYSSVLFLLLGCNGAFSQTSTPPANDDFANSHRLNGTNTTYAGTFAGATLEAGEVPPRDAVRTVWCSWVSPITGRGSFLRAIGYTRVYQGSNLSQLTLVSEDSIFLAKEGETYYFQLGSVPNSEDDSIDFRLEVSPFPPPTNDSFASPAILKGHSFEVWTDGWHPPATMFSVEGASLEPGEPVHVPDFEGGSLWWMWQAPLNGRLTLNTMGSTVDQVIIALYEGEALNGLRFLGLGTNSLSASVRAGHTYRFAALVPTGSIGDVLLQGRCMKPLASPEQILPGNLLRNASFENWTDDWETSQGVGGKVNERGGADGGTWIAPGSGVTVSQEFATVPGKAYRVHFAVQFTEDFGVTESGRTLRVDWNDQELGTHSFPYLEKDYWHWITHVVVANSSTSRLAVVNLGPTLELDAFSVLSLDDPPVITQQPKPLTTLSTGAAGFTVRVMGSEPLFYQWYFNDSELEGHNNDFLFFNSVSNANIGDYHVVISNRAGIVTSAVARLNIENPSMPQIFWQPHSETLVAGSYLHLVVAAIGIEPFEYQWYLDDQPLTDATNSFLLFPAVHTTNAGTYKIKVSNSAGVTWSLPAEMTVTSNSTAGVRFIMSNRVFDFGANSVDAPVFQPDGAVPLSGSNYVAQLYAGRTLDSIRPAGKPAFFQSGFSEGYFSGVQVLVPGLPVGSNAFLQVRAWDATQGRTYEEARARGAKFGKSSIFSKTVAPNSNRLTGLRSFSLQAGLPFFSAGTIRMVERLNEGEILYSLEGEPNSRYVIEKTVRDFTWTPYAIVTNITGTVNFTDHASSEANNVFYRARILE